MSDPATLPEAPAAWRMRLRVAVSNVLTAAVLGLLAADLYFAASQRLDKRLASPQAANLWFGSDIPYRLEVMRQPGGWENGGAHPLFPSIGHLFLRTAALVSGQSDPMRQAGLAGGLAGGLFIAISYLVFRRMRLTRIDATLFTVIGATSAGALFWFPVPESFGLAGVGVALALLVAAVPRPSVQALAAGCAASASCILTNGVVGGLAVLAHNARLSRWRRAVICLLLALGGMAAVWSVQEWWFGTPFFLSHRLLEYQQHLYPIGLERSVQVAQGLLAHPVVAPALHGGRPSFRSVDVATSGPLGVVATLAWLALLTAGVARSVGLARRGEQSELVFTAAVGLLLMLAMHLTLGREMFLYAMDVLPLLLTLAAASAVAPRGRTLVRVLAVVLLVTGCINNLRQFAGAAAVAREMAVQRVEAGTAVTEEP
jgi:hypothetical protein